MTVLAAHFGLLCLALQAQAVDDYSQDLFGDPLPPGAIARLDTARLRHGGQVNAIAFSPDSRHVLSGAWDRSLVLWEAKTGRRVRTFLGHRGPTPRQGAVWAVDFSPDGKLVISGSFDRTMILWDAATGKKIRTFVGPGGTIQSQY